MPMATELLTCCGSRGSGCHPERSGCVHVRAAHPSPSYRLFSAFSREDPHAPHHALHRLAAGGPRRRRRLRRPRPASGRDGQRRLGAGGRPLHLGHRLPLLLAHHRRAHLRPRRPQRHAGGAAQRRPRLRAHQPLGGLRPPLRRHRRRRTAGRAHPRRPVRLPAGHHLDHRRRGARRCGAGLHHPLWFDPSRRQEPRPARPGAHRTVLGLGDAVLHPRHPLHPGGGAGDGGGQRHGRESVVHRHRRPHHPHRHAHGRVDAHHPPRQGAGGERHRRGPALRRAVGRLVGPSPAPRRRAAHLPHLRYRAAPYPVAG